MTSASVPGAVFTEKDAEGLVAMGTAALRRRCADALAERARLEARAERAEADALRADARACVAMLDRIQGWRKRVARKLRDEHRARQRAENEWNCPRHRGENLARVAELEAEVERLTNKLNADSQSFEIECLKAEIERLRAEALRWYLPDGSFEVCASVAEVIARRKAAAVALSEVERLKAELIAQACAEDGAEPVSASLVEEYAKRIRADERRRIEAEIVGPHRMCVREVLEKHGLSDRIKPSMDEVDRLTGKRLGPEDWCAEVKRENGAEVKP